jgi:hypothetical protein
MEHNTDKGSQKMEKEAFENVYMVMVELEDMAAAVRLLKKQLRASIDAGDCGLDPESSITQIAQESEYLRRSLKDFSKTFDATFKGLRVMVAQSPAAQKIDR